MTALIQPHGGVLQQFTWLHCDQETWKEKLVNMKSWHLSQRQCCDLELLLNGGFSPLDGFMCREDYENVLNHCRLSNHLLWPMPITLDVNREFADTLERGEEIVLRDSEGHVLAIFNVEEIWEPDKKREAQAVFATEDQKHPAVRYLLQYSGPIYLGGKLQGVSLPKHYDFLALRKTPKQLREEFENRGWQKVVAFQTRNPMHRAHQELTIRAAKQCEANLLIHPVVGMTKPGDVDHYTRVRCYKKILPCYPEQTTLLSLLPLAMRMGGPREALWHAIIRKNYGCTHFIVGRDHAGPGNNSQNKPFYDPYAAQQRVAEHEKELGITMLPFQEMVFVRERSQYIPVNQAQHNETILKISGTECRRRLQEGLEIPDWFSYPEVIAELRRSYPPKHQQGFTVFFTGLSGAGKSTIANALMIKLMEMGGRSVTLLDGDIVRKNLSSELGFSREHRNLNIRKIGFVASEITKHRGIAICAPIAPYIDTRQEVREMVIPHGGFIEVYVSTPLSVCEQRDPKGLYAKARLGLIKAFTGISDPYEAPKKPDVEINTDEMTLNEAVQTLLLKIESMGYLAACNHYENKRATFNGALEEINV